MKNSTIHFIGIGAQKSGTSWLYNQFDKSNQIEMPPIKELHYFDRSTDYDSPNFLSKTKLTSRLVNPKWTVKSLLALSKEKENQQWYKKWFFSDFTDEWYLSLFENFHKCNGEITPAYAILNEEDVAKMSKLLGRDTKIIYMLRHPVERAWSSYKYRNRIKSYSSSDFEDAQRFMISDYQVLRSAYLQTIELYKKHFDSVCIGFFDAIIDQPKALLSNIFHYLELDAKEVKHFSGLDTKVNTSKSINIPENIKALLEEMYNEDISQLADLYGEYFIKWKNQIPHINQHQSDFKPSITI